VQVRASRGRQQCGLIREHGKRNTARKIEPSSGGRAKQGRGGTTCGHGTQTRKRQAILHKADRATCTSCAYTVNVRDAEIDQPYTWRLKPSHGALVVTPLNRPSIVPAYGAEVGEGRADKRGQARKDSVNCKKRIRLVGLPRMCGIPWSTTSPW